METRMTPTTPGAIMFSPEEMSFFDGLWDDEEDESSSSSSAAAGTPCPFSSSSSSSLEEKLLSLQNGLLLGHDDDDDDDGEEEGSSSSVHNDIVHVVGDVQNANHAELDAILAKDINRLSLKEREIVLQDVHGIFRHGRHQGGTAAGGGGGKSITENEEEDPEFIQQCLQELEIELNKIPKKKAYDQALYLSPEYVYDRTFRLMFLRGEEFQVVQAAKRLVRHLEFKLKLFGSKLLTQHHIRLCDLNNLDREILQEGGVQLLPIRDHAGRAILCILHKPLPPKTAINRQRCLWYIAMTGLQDEDTQKNGVIIVIINVAPHRISFEQSSYILQQHQISEVMPRKLVAVHYCCDDMGLLYSLITFTRFLLGSRIRGRFLTHSGTYTEYSYLLQTYGIPTHVIPINEEGTIQLTNHLDWLKRRHTQEATGILETAIIPRRFDVLFGKGRTVSEHSGNLRAFHIVEMNLSRYESVGKSEKTQIAEGIVHLIHQSYGRFLKRKRGGGWVEVSQTEARGKISHCFRRLRELNVLTGNASTKTKAEKRPNPSDD